MKTTSTKKRLIKKILICDDHTIIIRGLKYILDAHFENYEINEVHSLSELKEYLLKNPVDFAILDLQVSDGNIIEVLPEIKRLYPEIEVLIFSMTSEEVYAKRVLQLGAKGFLSKNADEQEVLRAFNIFFAGGNYLSQSVNNILVRDIIVNKKAPKENPFIGLSNREIEVVQYLLSAKSAKYISLKMELHANTIITYKQRIFSKLNVSNLIDLTNLAKVYNFL
jgi:DNA-binding NarL/FixJ family response regulator